MRSAVARMSVVFGSLALPMLLGCGSRGEPQPPATEVTVETGVVAKATLHAWVDAYGTVEAAPAAGGKPGGGARLAAPVAGLVRSIPVAEGQAVHAGDVLVRLDDRAAQAAVDKARAALKRAELTVAREQALLEQHNTSEKQVELAQEEAASARADLAAAQAQLGVFDLASPISGVVTRIQAQPGQAVDLSSVVAEVVDLQRLVVSVTVPASEAALLRMARPVEVRVDDNAGKPAAIGAVAFVSPSLEQKTGAALVRVALPADSKLWPGQLVHARILREEHADSLAVPAASVYTDHDGRSTLSVVVGDTATRRQVTVGLREGELVEVSGGGLKAGDRVVTVGSYGLPAKTKVRIVNAGAHPGEGASSR